MIIQNCYEPLELRFLKCLNPRMDLSSKEKQQLFSLEKGYAGELLFEKEWMEDLPGESFVINDLLLEQNGNVFQIDTSLISQNKIYLFDVKNYEGDYYLDGEIWRSKTGSEIKNPLLQLNRCESLLRQFLHNLQFNFPIEAHLVFINPEFTLYQASPDLPIIFPTQIPSFIKSLNLSLTKLNGTHSKLADQLIARQIDELKYARLPSYHYKHLKKGIVCTSCNSFMVISPRRSKLVCESCSRTEEVKSAVLRNVKQFQLLFPERKLTTNDIHEWCGVVNPKRRIRRILGNNYDITGVGKYSYYVKPE